MTMWQIVIAASIACVAMKMAGYMVPPRVLQNPAVSRIAELLTVALLAALIGVQTFAHGQEVVLDARVPAVIVAAGLLALRAPFIVVVIAAALVAAGIRAFV
ncbi:AzlD domain-containing protein [Microterricola viridarii]|uniref:Branched-chain amino acid transport protein (AzlD) n=1 Tax=Microterricola viridarii TaxID=412690 RepID=A0A1H1VKM2_9MICO|nr:AzlD domain-containing protein [Microterricola viridarii]SDS85070.1 Branched-chain amino acid transport protein (AzlD) [Microterricola viridarii]